MNDEPPLASPATARKPPYSAAVVRWAVVVGLDVLVLAGALIVLGTWTNDGWTAFDGSIECGDSLEPVLFLTALAMLAAAVAVVVVGLVRAIRSRSWASLLVSFAGLCLLTCGAACLILAVDVSYAASCD